MEGFVIILAVIVVIAIFIITRIRVVPQAQEYVIQRMGTYLTTWKAGIHFLVPFIDIVSNRVSIKEHVVDFKPQPVITKDNVTMQIDTVVFYQVTDSKLFTYGVQNPLMAIENLTATTLRNIIGEMELDSTLTSRDVINSKITSILDVATDKWGIKINRVELKNILPPREIQDAMEKQMKAERERREQILQAEGKKKSQVLVAEGEKEAKILAAEAQKQSDILRAEAEKQALILKAEGEAQSIRTIQQANADGIKMLNDANPDNKVIALKSLEAFKEAANGEANKIIIPSDIQGVAGLATAVTEIVKGDKK